VMIYARYIRRGVLSVQLLATTYDKDPDENSLRQSFSDEDMEEFCRDEARKWSSLSYQRQILGGETYEEYLEH